jgi:hypothetical protein
MRNKLRARALLGLVLLALGGLSCGEEGLVLPETPRVDLSAGIAAEFQVTAGRPTEVIFEVEADRPARLAAVVVGGSASDSFVVVARANDGSTELGRMTIGGAGGTSPRTIALPAFPSSQRLPLEVRGLRATDAGRVSLSVLSPGTAPEGTPALLAGTDTIVESFDGWDDEDRFDIFVDSGQLALVYFSKLGSPVPTQVQVQVFGPSSATVPIVDRSIPGTSNALEQEVMSFTALRSSAHRIVVRGPPRTLNLPVWSIGAYRMTVRLVNRAPETASATVTLGDTLSDAMDYVGDEDRYAVPITAGQPLQLRALVAKDVAATLTFTLQEPSRPSVQLVGVTAKTDWRNEFVSSDFVPTASGTATLIVRGATSGLPTSVLTGYSFTIGAPQRAPEVAPVALGLGATLTSEQLDGCADADEFLLTPTQDTYLAVGIARPAESGCAVLVELLGASGTIISQSPAIASRVEDVDSLRFARTRLVAGATYRLRVRADRTIRVSAPATPYTLDVFAIDSLPEDAPATIAFSDTPFAESITRCGDLDTFTWPPVPPGTLAVLSATINRTTRCDIRAEVLNTDDMVIAGVRVGGTANPDLDAASSRFTFAGSGQRLVLSSDVNGATADRGATFALRMDTVSVAPEVASASVVVGDTIAETLWRCGDVDSFTISGPPGDDILVSAWLERSVSCSVSLYVVRAGSPDSLLTTLGANGPAGASRFLRKVPETGSETYRVISDPSGSVADRGVSYRIALPVGDIEPEFVAATLLLGDTISGETLADANDIDRYTVALVPGERYTLEWSGPVRAVLEGPSTNRVVTNDSLLAPNGSVFSWYFTVTSAATYRLRVTPSSGSVTNAPYTLALHQLNDGPEGTGPFSVGAPIVELLAPFLDVDEFAIPAVSGRWYAMRFLLSAGSNGDAFANLNESGGGGPYPIPRVFSALSDTIRITVGGTLTSPAGYGGYELLLWTPDTVPETAPLTVTLGDSVTTESIDELGDVDVFELTLTAGQTVQLALIHGASCFPGDFRVLYSGPAGSGNFASWDTAVWSEGVTAVDAGTLRIAVYPDINGCGTGAYRLLTRLAP